MESFEEFGEIKSAHGAHADIAWRRIQVEDERSRVLQEVQDWDAVARTWPQNRYYWSVQQLEDHIALQRSRQYHHSLEVEVRTLDQNWRKLDEIARMQAQFKGKGAIPLDRAGLLGEFQRLGDKKMRAYINAKQAVREASEESKQTPTVILNKAVAPIGSRNTDMQALKLFVEEFKVFYGKSKHPSKKPSRTRAKK